MDLSQAQAVISTLSHEQKEALETAHWRYMAFAGVMSDGEAADRQAVVDRQAFAHLLKYTEDGRPSLSDERAAEFMAAVSGLPRDWCMAWDHHDFYVTHGVSFEEAVEKGLGRKKREDLASDEESAAWEVERLESRRDEAAKALGKQAQELTHEDIQYWELSEHALWLEKSEAAQHYGVAVEDVTDAQVHEYFSAQAKQIAAYEEAGRHQQPQQLH
jgi:hypothetical protein